MKISPRATLFSGLERSDKTISHGRLWRDGRAENTGLSPILLKNGSPADFSGWYMEWLEEALAMLKG